MNCMVGVLDVDQTKAQHGICGRRDVVWIGFDKDLWVEGRC